MRRAPLLPFCRKSTNGGGGGSRTRSRFLNQDYLTSLESVLYEVVVGKLGMPFSAYLAILLLGSVALLSPMMKALWGFCTYLPILLTTKMEHHPVETAGNQPTEISCLDSKKAPANRAFGVRLSFLTLRRSPIRFYGGLRRDWGNSEVVQPF